ncbi:MAG: pirin family protein [Gammaproteobacteria bacterium]|nr:pirin family protein [Gammaproteobacteria bacterium]MDP2348426.1 pirin family protein [Gammaproteobacteria bacterium]
MPLLISPRTQDIGFPVQRLLPVRERQRVGPFIFLDHMGPATFPAGSTSGDVRQHPHIGLATVTYLFSGAIMHRDSLGVVQRIEPGAINLMTAGSGIVHSERMPPDIREAGAHLQGLQTWLALPTELEEIAPAFEHYPASTIPVCESAGVRASVLIGEVDGKCSPVKAHSPTTFVDVQMQSGASFETQVPGHELAVYMANGSATVNGELVPEHHLLVVNDSVNLQALSGECRAVVLGGEPLEGKRYIHWNFVSSSTERIKQAGADWTANRFTLVPGEVDRIPLPD